MPILRTGGAFWAAARCTEASTAVTTKSPMIFLPMGFLLLPVTSCVFARHHLCAYLRVDPRTIPQEWGRTQFPPLCTILHPTKPNASGSAAALLSGRLEP